MLRVFFYEDFMGLEGVSGPIIRATFRTVWETARQPRNGVGQDYAGDTTYCGGTS